MWGISNILFIWSLVISFLSYFIPGVFTGLLASWIYHVTSNRRKEKSLKKLYDSFAGTYLVFRKNNDSTAISEVEVKVKNGVLRTSGKRLIGDPTTTEGEIRLDEQITNYGRGYYRHVDKAGFGFFEVQLCKPDILVHATYYNENNIVAQAHVWRKK